MTINSFAQSDVLTKNKFAKKMSSVLHHTKNVVQGKCCKPAHLKMQRTVVIVLIAAAYVSALLV